jgi:hypothetical protein
MEVQTRNFRLRSVYPSNSETPSFKLEDHRGDHRERSLYFDDVKFGSRMGYSRDAIEFKRVRTKLGVGTELNEETDMYETTYEGPPTVDESDRHQVIFIMEKDELPEAIVEQLKHIETYGTMKGSDEITEP